MDNDLIDQEKAISEFIGGPVKIIERRKNCVLFQSIARHENKYIVSYPLMSWFSFQSVKNVSDINIAFELCEKFANFEEVIKHNFEWSTYSSEDEEITIGLIYCVYVDDTHFYITKEYYNIVGKYDKSSVTIYDILNHPDLQPFRINHSKPVNRTTID